MPEKYIAKEVPNAPKQPERPKISPETQRALEKQKEEARQKLTQTLLKEIITFGDKMGVEFEDHPQWVKPQADLVKMAQEAFLLMGKTHHYDPQAMIEIKNMQSTFMRAGQGGPQIARVVIPTIRSSVSTLDTMINLLRAEAGTLAEGQRMYSAQGIANNVMNML